MDTMLRRSGYHDNAELAQERRKQILCGFGDFAGEFERLSCVPAFLRHLAW